MEEAKNTYESLENTLQRLGLAKNENEAQRLEVIMQEIIILEKMQQLEQERKGDVTHTDLESGRYVVYQNDVGRLVIGRVVAIRGDNDEVLHVQPKGFDLTETIHQSQLLGDRPHEF
jgi:hypothetical protein